MVVKDINVSRLLDDYLDYLRTSGVDVLSRSHKKMTLKKIDRECGLFAAPATVVEWVETHILTNTKTANTELREFYEWVAAR